MSKGAKELRLFWVYGWASILIRDRWTQPRPTQVQQFFSNIYLIISNLGLARKSVFNTFPAPKVHRNSSVGNTFTGFGIANEKQLESISGEYMRGRKKKEIRISPADLHAMRAIEERVAWFTVVVDASVRDLKWGSGTLFGFKGRRFILTCEHVLEGYKEKYIHILYRSNKPLEYCENKEWTKRIPDWTLEKAYPIKLAISAIHFGDEEDDLALIEIDKDDRRADDLEFYELPQDLPARPTLKRQVFLTGFSREFARVQTKGKVTIAGVFPYFHASIIVRKVRPKKLVYNPEKHFLIDYELDRDSVDPHGLSGSGVWSRDPSGPGNLWHPNIFLMGVQQAVSWPSQVLKITKLKRVYRILRKIVK